MASRELERDYRLCDVWIIPGVLIVVAEEEACIHSSPDSLRCSSAELSFRHLCAIVLMTYPGNHSLLTAYRVQVEDISSTDRK